MSKAAKSVFIFGIYVTLTGLGLLLVPNLILDLLGFPNTVEQWIYVVAVVVLILGYYYIQAACSELKAFFRFTVHARSVVILFLTAFILLNLAQPALITFGVVDLLGAIWTALALRKL